MNPASSVQTDVSGVCASCHFRPASVVCEFCGQYLCAGCHSDHLQRVADDMSEGFPGT